MMGIHDVDTEYIDAEDDVQPEQEQPRVLHASYINLNTGDIVYYQEPIAPHSDWMLFDEFRLKYLRGLFVLNMEDFHKFLGQARDERAGLVPMSDPHPKPQMAIPEPSFPARAMRGGQY